MEQEILAMLQKINETAETALTYQEKMVENIFYVRERCDKLSNKLKSISDRLLAIETRLEEGFEITPQIPSNKKSETIISLIESAVDSVRSTVNSVKGEVQNTVQLALKQDNDNKMLQIQYSLSRITSEFNALKELTLDSITEEP